MAQPAVASTDQLLPGAPASVPLAPGGLGRSLPRRAVDLGRVVLPFVVLVAIWWAVKAIYDLKDNVLASPSAVASAVWDLLRRGILTDYAGLSLQRLGVAVIISIAVAVPIGMLLGLNRYVALAFEPFLRFFQAVSGIAWLPLLIVWYGFSDSAILALILYTLTIPIVFNTMVGVRSVPARYRDMCRSLGAGWLQVVRDVDIPGALPNIIVGFRLGIAYGFRALIAGEMVIAQGGMGDLIFAARTGSQIDRVMAGMIVIGVMSLILDRLVLQPLQDLTVGRWGVLRS
jgi:taurine transport system permease protein